VIAKICKGATNQALKLKITNKIQKTNQINYYLKYQLKMELLPLAIQPKEMKL